MGHYASSFYPLASQHFFCSPQGFFNFFLPENNTMIEKVIQPSQANRELKMGFVGENVKFKIQDFQECWDPVPDLEDSRNIWKCQSDNSFHGKFAKFSTKARKVFND